MARPFMRSSDPGYAHLLADGVYEENLTLRGECEHVETLLASPDASQMYEPNGQLRMNNPARSAWMVW